MPFFPGAVRSVVCIYKKKRGAPSFGFTAAGLTLGFVLFCFVFRLYLFVVVVEFIYQAELCNVLFFAEVVQDGKPGTKAKYSNVVCSTDFTP